MFRVMAGLSTHCVLSLLIFSNRLHARALLLDFLAVNLSVKKHAIESEEDRDDNDEMQLHTV